MAKFLLIVAVIAVLVLLFKNYQRSIARQQGQGQEPEAKTPPENMVRCAQCGVHLPRSEAFLSQGSYFCSEEHRRLGVSGRDDR